MKFLTTAITVYLLTNSLMVLSGSAQGPSPAQIKFEMVVEGQSPYLLNDRKDLSINTGGGKGVLISPRWAMTASHCITSSKQKAGKVNIRFTVAKGKSAQIRVDKVIRHKSKDIALLHLVRPVKAKEQMPVLLLRETLSGPVKYKKVAGNLTWRNIPAIGKKDNLVVRKKTDRKGEAGTSGSPWVLHSSKVGDVLIGITHGGGRAPQVAFVSRWIQETVQKHDPDRLVWATRKQALAK